MKKHLIVTGKAVVFFAFWAASLVIMSIPAVFKPVLIKGNSAFLRLWWEFIPLLALFLITGIFVWAVEKNKIKVPILKNPLRNTVLGMVLGCVWLGGTILVLSLIGDLTLGSKNDISYFAVWMLSVLLNVIMQEYLVRGYLFSLFREKYNTATAVIITTVLFMAMHGGVFEAGIVAVLNVITMSVFVSLLLIHAESLLAPIIVHFIWNGVGCLVFGVVSLADDYPSLWNCVISGNNFLSGGDAKIEGSIITLIMNGLLILFMVYRLKQRIPYQ